VSAEGALLEGGWVLEGTDGAGRRVRLAIADRELARAGLGITVGRHPALCERLIGDPTVSRRHLRLGLDRGRLAIEDLNSLNGTLLNGREVPRFRPVPLNAGQELVLGAVQLHVVRLEPEIGA
jgi:predicted component of type VI protein secretion system